MKQILIDKTNTIIYEGNNASKLLTVLLKDPRDVTEDDEVNFEKELRTLSWINPLRHEKHFTLKFKGFDDWDRPVFKDIDSNIYFGSVNHLRGSMSDLLDYLKAHPYELEYFGDKFNCEPHGGLAKNWKIKITDD